MTDTELRARYLGVGGFAPHSLKALARLLGVARSTVRRRLRRLGVRVRLPAEARDLHPPPPGRPHTPEAKAKMAAAALRRWARMGAGEREAVRRQRREAWWRRTGGSHQRMRVRAARAPKGRLKAALRSALEAAGVETRDGGPGGADFLAVGRAATWAVLADGFWRLQQPVERVLARAAACGPHPVLRVCHPGRRLSQTATRKTVEKIRKIVYSQVPPPPYQELDYHGEG